MIRVRCDGSESGCLVSVEVRPAKVLEDRRLAKEAEGCSSVLRVSESSWYPGTYSEMTCERERVQSWAYCRQDARESHEVELWPFRWDVGRVDEIEDGITGDNQSTRRRRSWRDNKRNQQGEYRSCHDGVRNHIRDTARGSHREA